MSVSVAVLGPGPLSVVPLGGVTTTLLVSSAVSEEANCTVCLKVRLDPEGRLTVVLRAPLPLLLPATVAPPVAERAT